MRDSGPQIPAVNVNKGLMRRIRPIMKIEAASFYEYSGSAASEYDLKTCRGEAIGLHWPARLAKGGATFESLSMASPVARFLIGLG
jgi:hypothetical protein